MRRVKEREMVRGESCKADFVRFSVFLYWFARVVREVEEVELEAEGIEVSSLSSRVPIIDITGSEVIPRHGC